MLDQADLEDGDKRYIWHPFTQMKEWTEGHPVIIDRGEGCFLIDVDGRRYLDGVSSLWVNIHGHRKKEINDAIRAQLDKIAHTTLLGLSSVPAIQLAERLAGLLQKSLCCGGNASFGQARGPALTHIFYSDNGSTAVEVALKMAFQYWRHKGVEGRNAFLSLNNAYHGDTIGAVSVGGVDIFHGAFGPLLFKTFRSPSPYCYRCELGRRHPECGLECLSAMEEQMVRHRGEIAAVILEPLVQAAGGMIVSPPGYLRGVRELCTKYGLLMIADEVATGFGRTGRMFACEHEGVSPDLICLSKGLTGGYLPLAVTAASEEIYGAFLGDFRELKTFFHGHSYTGNPLGCAAGLACLDVFEKEEVIKGLVPKTELFARRLGEIAGLPHVGDVRCMGLMAGIELVRDRQTREAYAWEEKVGWQVSLRARAKGLFIRPLGNVIVLMPPLSISLEELEWMLDVIRDTIREVE